ncbi:uncharacterized protein SPAPADRAFT_55715 [Spathaspora passalidarum NRRL Y-27907]|uniref:Metallo-beta-lactamase domain-containing protein n=1 Tax=Spathaspora passalidarum (strain NRRL Y-27907 / 11-Y1) TaxID=619300 RepID=G3APN2_SPAPN|nr:uncharacterized protein SPAPADRAFT_55715 [Spathaspora passalidarum NRRL Y-27907]EGW32203.1 hypothetical protein SPAPADRAFT_55715 [Spathaspora passalidarum NRRL Y-27907]
MGYPELLKVVTKKLSDNIVTVSCPFSLLNKLNIGARMTIFHYDGDVIVWSPLPYNKEILNNAIKELTNEEYTIKYVIVVNTPHNMCASEYKRQIPGIKLVAPAPTKVDVDIDIKLGHDNALKIIKDEMWTSELGITDQSFIKNLELVYNSYHKNRELHLFEKNAKTLFVGDLLFNLGIHGTTTGTHTLEQYCPEVGYEKGFNPHSWWSFPTRYMQPFSIIGRYLMNDSQNIKKYPEETKKTLKLLNSWDFKEIVVLHGDVIKNGKEAFASIFGSSLN